LFSPEEIASRLNAKLEGNRETLLGILNRLIKAEKVAFLKSVFAKHRGPDVPVGLVRTSGKRK